MIIRLQDMTPDVYTRESRDFQLLCRAYDCVFNGVKFDIDSMLDIVDTKMCNAILLQLLQTKIGFFSSASITDAELRLILEAFPVLIKNKGSKKSIIQALNIFLKLNNIKTGCYLNIVNESTDKNLWEDYTINIGIESSPTNLTVLSELLRFIVPTGYKISYFFYSGSSQASKYIITDEFEFVYTNDYLRSLVLANSDGIVLGDPIVVSDVIAGYYYNGEFYLDAEHTTVITPILNSDTLYYKDLSSDTGDGKYKYYICNSVSPTVTYKEVNYAESAIIGYYNESDDSFYLNFDAETGEYSDIVEPIASGRICYYNKLSEFYDDVPAYYVCGKLSSDDSSLGYIPLNVINSVVEE